tara:strand:- start:107 stop:547 length:441 start_codon:yes stop_codon:yes gene_type:complete
MGYRIQTVNDITVTSEIGLGIELSFNNLGVFKSVYTTNNQAKANLRNLLLTRIGERYEQVNFGTNLLNLVFNPSNDELKQEISEEITSKLSFWLPYIVIENLEILNSDDDASLLHAIKITLKYTVDGFSTDTITILAGENGRVTVE